MKHLVRKALPTALLAVLMVTGCSHTAPSGSVSDQADSYQRDLWAQIEADTQKCMAAKGFAYEPRPFQGQSSGVPSLDPYGLTEDEARARGFGVVDAHLADARADDAKTTATPGAASDLQQPPGYEEALYGARTMNNGCQAQATAQAATEVNIANYPALQQRQSEIEKVLADPRTGAFWASWSQCMATHAIDFPDEDSLIMDFDDRATSLVIPQLPLVDPTTGVVTMQPDIVDYKAADALRAEEITAAVATVGCLKPLHSLWDEILADAQR